MDDLISRQAAIDALKNMYGSAEKWAYRADDEIIKARAESCTASLVEMKLRIEKLPSAQPERLEDNDFETIRIHLNAFKEKLCNQRRWEEAREYQRILDRFMAFATARQEIIRCKDCKHYLRPHGCGHIDGMVTAQEDGFCSYAERRTDE